jgi:hypothetical protein
MRCGILTFLALVAAPALWAQTGSAVSPRSLGRGSNGVHPTEARSIRAVARTSFIVVDGILDDSAWAQAPAATDFIQSQPNEGQPATQRTEVRFLFDADALYIGARMYDSLGAAGVRTRLVRRDQFADADELAIIFDTFHDHLGRTQFTINPSGVKGDSYGPGGAGADASWDPVYEVKTAIDSAGWTAEFRIPLSQLRFPNQVEQTWGLQVVRFVSRLNERSHWAFWRLNESGGPSRYGHVEGLAFESSRRRGLEVLPYVVGQSTSRGVVEEGNPFQSRREAAARVGVDAIYQLTSNLTLSATVNPDFGQVEVDPAVVNLGVFETFFPERRPFFVEGAGLFRFGGLSCYSCSNTSGLSLLHSRRIGRSPQGAQAAYAAGSYADVPANTRILGAAKVTGRTAGGWSIGVLNALTAREHALVQVDDSTRRSVEVEPFTNYFAARIARDFRGGMTQVRVMGTSVVRDLSDSALANRLNRHSEVLGMETDNWFSSRRYRLMTTLAFSNISGDTGALLRAQLSSARYFQRPDRDAGSNGLFTDRYDPTLTSMRGFAAYTRFSKEGGDWLYEAQMNTRSPGFEANDLAFNTRVDYVWFNGNLRRRWTRPTRYYRFLSVGVGGQYETNYDGDFAGTPQVHGSAYLDLPNYWWAGIYGHVRPERLDERLTRGGPAVNRPAEWFLNWNAGTDSRKSVVLDNWAWVSRNSERSLDAGTGLDVTIRPRSNVQLSFGPSVSRLISRQQFVRAVDDSTATAFGGRRYIFADLDQASLSMNTRVRVTFSPTLSLEVFAQPLLTSAEYGRFKEFARPRSAEKLVYGTDVGTIVPDSTLGYVVDPDGDGPADTLYIRRPDFTFRSLRGNAVLRWEFRPGSTLFLVWQQSRVLSDGRGRLDAGRDIDRLRRAPADNVFLMKVSYWFGL